MRILLILAIQFALALPAAADVLNFSGTVSSISDPNNYFNGIITVGESYFGSFTYDVTSTPTSGDPNSSAQYAPGADYDLTFNIGGDIFEDLNQSAVINVSQGNLFLPGDLNASAPPNFITIPSYTSTTFALQLFGDYQNTANDAVTDPSVFNLTTSFADVGYHYSGGNSGFNLAISSITATAAPEPTTLLLGGLGIAATLVVRLYARKQTR
jgi:hypothetical protein